MHQKRQNKIILTGLSNTSCSNDFLLFRQTPFCYDWSVSFCYIFFTCKGKWGSEAKPPLNTPQVLCCIQSKNEMKCWPEFVKKCRCNAADLSVEILNCLHSTHKHSQVKFVQVSSASDSTFDYWRYINIWLTLTLTQLLYSVNLNVKSFQFHKAHRVAPISIFLASARHQLHWSPNFSCKCKFVHSAQWHRSREQGALPPKI